MTPFPENSKSVEATSLSGPFVVAAIAVLVAMAWVCWDEFVSRRPYVAVQEAFAKLCEQRGVPVGRTGVVQVMGAGLGFRDRCQTCHLAVDRPGFSDPEIPQVFRTHSRRDEILGKHPVERFGCTTCHHGQGLQTKGVAHANFDHGYDDPYWERPLLVGSLVQSACVQCHTQEQHIPDAEVFERGRALFVQRRCYGCHDTKYLNTELLPKAGPDLLHVARKMTQSTIFRWLREGHVLRANSRMPQFWPNGSGDAASETAAIAAFLWNLSAGESPAVDASAVDLDSESQASTGSPERGQRIFEDAGCRACHRLGTVDPAKETALSRAARARADFGPDLDAIGLLATPQWLSSWLENPQAMRHGARMPQIPLAEGQRQDLVAFLASLKGGHAATQPADEAFQDSETQRAEGRRLVVRYGCYGCHRIPGFEDAGRAGPDLSAYGDEPPDEHGRGATVSTSTRHPLASWTVAKLLHPRAMAEPGESPVMPVVAMSDDEAMALSVFLLANRSKSPPPDYVRKLSEGQLALARGEALIEAYNCRGCHEIGRDEERTLDDDGALLDIRFVAQGGDIAWAYSEPTLGPPSLTFAGEKLQYAWLFDYLRSPHTVRPWLVVRMPRFDFSDLQAQILVRYFAAMRDQPFPFVQDARLAVSAEQAAAGSYLFNALQCAKCHSGGVSNAGVVAAELAPSLVHAPQRLRVGWQRRWLLDPQYLQPGTQMPAFFPLADDDDPHSFMSPYPGVLDGDVRAQVDALIAHTHSTLVTHTQFQPGGSSQ